jgi:hypothetical protein
MESAASSSINRLSPADIQGRKIVGAIHVDYARASSAWMGQVEGVPRLDVARGFDRGKEFRRWYVDSKPVRSLEAALAVLNGDITLEAAMQQEKKPTKKYSLAAQITEVKRELGQREQVYPRLVKSNKLREGVAEYQTDTLKAVLATLEWLRANEADVRAFVTERSEARKQNGDDRGAVA